VRLTKTTEQAALTATMDKVFAAASPPAIVREAKEQGGRGPAVDRVWQTLASARLIGLATGTEWGGEGASLIELGLLFEAGGRVLCPTALYEGLKFARAVETLATDAQKAALLPDLVRGERHAVAVLHDPSDAADIEPRLRAEQVDGGWQLHGTLDLVPHAADDTTLLVTARVDTFPGSPRIVAALVDTAHPDVHRTSSHTISGDRVYRVVLDAALVPSANLMGTTSDAGIARDDLTRLAHSFVVLQCMEMVGGTGAVLERTVAHILVREQFGRPIGSFQAAQHLIADMRIDYDAARLAAYQALWCVAEGVPSLRPVAIAKMQCSEAYKWATLTAHQLHGGMGYVRETDLHLWSERAKVAEVLGGTADVAAGWLQNALGLDR
jgi:alkylation response protein AidB-like acyl-CoA dehydrogenase